LIENLIKDVAKKLEKEGKSFNIKDCPRYYNDAGNIPVELIKWEMTGNKK
tara:strand:- start:551 stop:700 length:150 start_codon:yes stop_codon:yes gene_type:complete